MSFLTDYCLQRKQEETFRLGDSIEERLHSNLLSHDFVETISISVKTNPETDVSIPYSSFAVYDKLLTIDDYTFH